MDRLDYKNKATWTADNAARIAEEFHYVPDANFMNALGTMIEMVQKATVVELLGSVAQGLFSSWKPPLEQVPSRIIHQDQPTPQAPTIAPRGNIFRRLSRSG